MADALDAAFDGLFENVLPNEVGQDDAQVEVADGEPAAEQHQHFHDMSVGGDLDDALQAVAPLPENSVRRKQESLFARNTTAWGKYSCLANQ